MKLGAAFARTLASARAGSQQAWAELYRAIAPDLLGYLRARRVPDAEDVVGETFLQVVRDLARFDGDDEGSFRAWTFTIASNRAIDHFRSAGRRERAETQTTLHAVRALADSAEDEALASAATNEALAMLDAVPPAQRRVILLKIFGGFSAGEIARIEQMREATVRSHLRRGLMRLERMVRTDQGPGATERSPQSLS